ncbi:MAG: hypothetical protein QOG78_4065, partial [Rhodospirillaceae bacterium]|nr:hypothetical protein [Rhodospirillaceae bacterium]
QRLDDVVPMRVSLIELPDYNAIQPIT